MSRLTTVRIEGKEFPLFFSVLAMEKIYDKFGSMQGMMDEVLGAEDNPARQLSKVLDVLSFENYAGVKYLEHKGEKGERLDKESLLITMSPFEVSVSDLWMKALECINAGQEREVETEANLKNGEATQEGTL